MQYIDLAPGDKVTIGGVVVSIATGWRFRPGCEVEIALDGPRSIPVDRGELHEEMQRKRAQGRATAKRDNQG